MTMPSCVRFVPSRVEGWPDVREVVFHGDHLDVLCGDVWQRIDYASIARSQEPRWIALLRRALGRRPTPRLVADRDWFKAPPDRSLTLYTRPPLLICMPDDEPVDHDASYFWRVQQVIRAGGYVTWDGG